MSDKAQDMNATVVSRIWVRQTAGQAKVISNITVAKHGIGSTAKIAILPEGLIWWDTKDVSPTNDVNGCDNWIKRGIRQTCVFANCEVAFRFVKAKA